MQTVRRRRLSADAWSAMVEKFEASGLPEEVFCQQERVSLASLQRWRTKPRSESGKKLPPPRAAAVVGTAPCGSRDYRCVAGIWKFAWILAAAWCCNCRAADGRTMFFPEGQLRVYLYGQPADLRRSFDGLQALVRQGLGGGPLDGGLYVFINRRGNQIRVLYFDRSGFCLWAKRLEAGRFISDWRTVRSRAMDWT
jgi:transposase